MNWVKEVAIIASFSLLSLPAFAQTVATWNVGWLMAKPTYEKWVASCKKHGWPTDINSISDPQAQKNAKDDLQGLPYCNVHNGMAFPPDSCLIEDPKKLEGWPNQARYSANHPCRASADLAESWDKYLLKVNQLKKMASELAASAKVDILVLQEVFDENAVKQILPPGWQVITTRGFAGSPNIPQHIAVAFPENNPAKVRDVDIHVPLSNVGAMRNPVRPGILFTADIQNQPVRFLGVHLKAGCRSAEISDPQRKDYHTDQDIIRLQKECNVFMAQVPLLETWIEDQARNKREFAIVGDFNRSIGGEIGKPARKDGTSPQSKLTCKINETTNKTECSSPVSYLFPEISDGDPNGANLVRSFFRTQENKELKLRQGRYPENSRGACVLKTSTAFTSFDRVAKKTVTAVAHLAHDGIDHILVSESLSNRLGKQGFELVRYNYRAANIATSLVIGPADAVPSDHCPHFVSFK
jgi:endonuclease/exonuclease/phosphatase family metal-dependent hydrolase